MRSVLIYAIIFAAPLLLYYLWLRFLCGKLGFLFLLPVIVCADWLALWPVSYLPVWQSAVEKPDDSADAVVNGFLAHGLLYGIIGCLPVIVIDAIRSFLQWGAARHRAAGKSADVTS